MKKIIYPALIAFVLFTSAFTLFKTTNKWIVKEEAYSVKFTSKKFGGAFKGLKSELIFDENNLSNSKLLASIETNTINTGNGMRNKHANQGLESSKYPTVKFVSSSVNKSGSGYETLGKLTIKNVTKDVKIPFQFIKTSNGGIFEGNFSVKPADFNVTKNGTPEILEFKLSIPVTK